MNTKTRLLMSFKSDLDKTVSISVDDPRDDIQENEIKQCMQLILDKNIFSISGAPLVSMVDAKVVTTDTTEFDLV